MLKTALCRGPRGPLVCLIRVVMVLRMPCGMTIAASSFDPSKTNTPVFAVRVVLPPPPPPFFPSTTHEVTRNKRIVM